MSAGDFADGRSGIDQGFQRQNVEFQMVCIASGYRLKLIAASQVHDIGFKRSCFGRDVIARSELGIQLIDGVGKLQRQFTRLARRKAFEHHRAEQECVCRTLVRTGRLGRVDDHVELSRWVGAVVADQDVARDRVGIRRRDTTGVRRVDFEGCELQIETLRFGLDDGDRKVDGAFIRVRCVGLRFPPHHRRKSGGVVEVRSAGRGLICIAKDVGFGAEAVEGGYFYFWRGSSKRDVTDDELESAIVEFTGDEIAHVDSVGNIVDCRPREMADGAAKSGQ